MTGPTNAQIEFDVAALFGALDAQRRDRMLAWQGVARELWSLVFRGISLTGTKLLNCLGESRLPLRTFLLGGFHHSLSIIVPNCQVGAVFDEERGLIIQFALLHRSENF